MANRNRTNTAGKIGYKLDQTNPRRLLSSSIPKTNEKNDDLIGSLSERHENQRARQVGEWEQLYSTNVYRAV